MQCAEYQGLQAAAQPGISPLSPPLIDYMRRVGHGEQSRPNTPTMADELNSRGVLMMPISQVPEMQESKEDIPSFSPAERQMIADMQRQFGCDKKTAVDRVLRLRQRAGTSNHYESVVEQAAQRAESPGYNPVLPTDLAEGSLLPAPLHTKPALCYTVAATALATVVAACLLAKGVLTLKKQKRLIARVKAGADLKKNSAWKKALSYLMPGGLLGVLALVGIVATLMRAQKHHRLVSTADDTLNKQQRDFAVMYRHIASNSGRSAARRYYFFGKALRGLPLC